MIKVISLFILLSFEFLPQSLQQKIINFNNSETLKHGQWGVYAAYADNGEEIISYNSEYSLAPASNLKLITSAAVLHYLGDDYRFTTKIYFDGSISKDGVLNGNIYIVGGGDPTLGSELVKGSLPLDELMNSWLIEIQKAGIKKINGSVIADDFMYDQISIPDYWPWIDIGNYYGAGTSALTINDNLYYLFFKPGKNTGDNAEVLRTEPFVEGLTFINDMKTGPVGSGDNGYIYNAPTRYEAHLRGTIPAGVDEFSIKGSLPDPPLFAAQHFNSLLELNGIEVTQPPKKSEAPVIYNESKLITKTISPPLKDIVYIINKKSFNLYTEMVLKAIGYEITGTGSYEKGIELIKKFLEENNIPTTGLDLYDGSGLSRTNKVTPKLIVEMLTMMTKHKSFDSFFNSLGVAGDPDDLSAFRNWGIGTPIAYNAFIKSGTVNGVRAHSGYVRNKSGRLIAFSFIANNFAGSNRNVNSIHQEILIHLSEIN